MFQKLNFFVASFLSIMGFSLAAEIFLENDPEDKVDDIAFLILGFIAILWYRKSADKKTIAPVIFTAVGLLIKFAAIIVEHADKEALGDDIGIAIGLILALTLVITQYLKLKKL